MKAMTKGLLKTFAENKLEKKKRLRIIEDSITISILLHGEKRETERILAICNCFYNISNKSEPSLI